MPYFVFKIFPGKKLEFMEKFDSYKEARGLARETRKTQQGNDDYTVKLVFAANQDQAERELTTEREAPILMEHEK